MCVCVGGGGAGAGAGAEALALRTLKHLWVGNLNGFVAPVRREFEHFNFQKFKCRVGGGRCHGGTLKFQIDQRTIWFI